MGKQQSNTLEENRPRQDFGVIYFVDKNPAFQNMLNISIQSLKRFHPDWPMQVCQCQSPPVPLWKKVYRLVSFWKWQERANRANQDTRVTITKPSYMLNSPFRCTLFLDVDTIVMRSLDVVKQSALEYDIVATSMPWKQYNGFEAWQASRFPMVNSGVVLYNERFKEVYRSYVDRLWRHAGTNPSFVRGDDQYMVSMACHMEQGNLRVLLEPHLQIDAMNIAQHFGCEDYPKKDGVLDLTYDGLKDFYVFHYNGPHKRAYLQQIKEVWGLPNFTP